MDSIKRNDLPRLLRVFGVLAMLLSGTIFLLQGLQELDQFARFLCFTGLTLSTGLLGIFCSVKLKEPKGARTLLALATTAVPVLTAQFGAMIYQVVQGSVSQNLPEYFRFASLPNYELGICAITTLVFGSIVSYLGFSVLDREQRTNYWINFFALTALIVVPLRSGYFLLAPIAVLAFSVAYLVKLSKAVEDWRMTNERLIAWGLLALPVVITIGRAAFYELDLIWLSAFFYMTALLLMMKDIAKAKSGNFSLVFGIAGTIALSMDILRPLENIQQVVITLLIVHLPLRYALSRGYEKAGHMMTFVWVAGSILILDGLLFNIWGPQGHAPTFVTATVLLLAGAIGVLEGYHFSQKTVFNSGIITGVLGIIFNFYLAFDRVHLYHWLSLAIVGASVLIAASVLERHQEAIRARWAILTKRFQ